MKYFVIPAAYATRAFELHRQGKPAGAEELVAPRGAGETIDADRIAKLADALWALAKAHKTPKGHLAPKDPRGGEFESRACEVVHKMLPLPRRVASDGEFWTWLTFAAHEGGLASLVDWRFGPNSHPSNYGVTTPGSIREGLFARLWWRGDIGYWPDNAKDAYAIARAGDQDIWRSHIFRTRYGRNREFAREFLQTVFDGEERRHNRAVEREMAKLTRARHASTAIEVLDVTAKREVLTELVIEATTQASDSGGE